jgi:tetratricopeptide (TPR) repeat protein
MDYGYKQIVLGADRNAGLDNLRKGSAMLEQIVAAQPQDLKARRMLGLSYSRLAGSLADDSARQNEALDLYKKAIAIKQALVQADPTNAEFQRLVAYDKFARAELLANMKQPEAALAGHREALAEFQKLAAADPANAQLQQDLGRVREDMGEILAGLGRTPDALQQFKTSLAVLAKLPGADDPHTLNGGTVLMDQLWLGKVHTSMAASGNLPEKEVMAQCREAQSWFAKCLPGWQELRDHAPAQYGGAERVAEIQTEKASCQHILKTH